MAGIRKATVILEDIKEEIITHLDKVQRTKSAWYSANMIRTGVRRNADTIKKALYELATEGFLNIRHNPEEETRLLYRLRRDNPLLVKEVREVVEGDHPPLLNVHYDDGTPDFGVECAGCRSNAVTEVGSYQRDENQYPSKSWKCHACGKITMTTDSRDYERHLDNRPFGNGDPLD